MAEDRTREELATAKADVRNLERRVGNLEGNQKWAVLTIIGLVAKAGFDAISKVGL